ncbi:MAG: biotin--[acetyl-CoA-carboxylase] ligase [Raoultibacter sp.]
MLTLSSWRIAEGLDRDFFSIRCGDVTASTNEEIKIAARAGAREGLVCTALEQRSGYGRQGRSWVSPQGGLYLSLLLTPEVEAAELPTLSLVVSLAVRQALIDVGGGRDISIKWPNDVMCPGGKLCGISLETIGAAVCVGVGINVFRPARKQPVGGKHTPAYLCEAIAAASGNCLPSSISKEGLTLDQQRELERIATALLNCIDLMYHRWLQTGFLGFVAAYNEHVLLAGSSVTIASVEGDIIASGIVESVDAAGRLCLRTAEGTLLPINSGEVHLL